MHLSTCSRFTYFVCRPGLLLPSGFDEGPSSHLMISNPNAAMISPVNSINSVSRLSTRGEWSNDTRRWTMQWRRHSKTGLLLYRRTSVNSAHPRLLPVFLWRELQILTVAGSCFCLGRRLRMGMGPCMSPRCLLSLTTAPHVPFACGIAHAACGGKVSPYL